MNRITNVLSAALILSCLAGCACKTTGKIGPGRLDLQGEVHGYRGFAVNPKNGERSVTLGVVTVGGDARLEPVQPRVLDFGFGIDVPAQTQPQ